MRSVVLVLAGLLVIGCAPNPEEVRKEQERNKAAIAKAEANKPARMKAVADDTSISDEQAIEKYVGMYAMQPAVFVSGTKKFVEVLPIGGGIPGHMLEVKVYDLTFFAKAGSDADKLYQAERDSIKQAADFCEATLRDLKGRGMKGVSYHIYSRVEGQPDTEIFRVTATGNNLPAMEKAKGPAEAGSVYDPRGTKINDLWKVEKNTYSMYDYKKK